MDTLPGTSEIVESIKELDLELKVNEHAGNRRKLKPGQICSIEDDINQLFEAIDIRITGRCSGLLRQVGKDSLPKSAMKRPIRPGPSQNSGIGISGSASLKQALRGLCISQASEMAAMKRLSKPAGLSRPSRVSEAGTIKRLYREVVVEGGESGLPLNDGKGNLVEISIVPEGSTSNLFEKTSEYGKLSEVEILNQSAHCSTLLVDTLTPKAKATKILPEEEVVSFPTHDWNQISMEELRKNGLPTLTHASSSTHSSEKLPACDEIVPASAELLVKPVEPDKKQISQLHFGSSLSSNDDTRDVIKSVSSQRIIRPVFRNKNFIKKKVKHNSASVPSSSNQCNDGVDNDLGPSTSKMLFEGPKFALMYGNKEKKKSSPASSTAKVSEVSSSVVNSDPVKPGFTSNFNNITKSLVSKADARLISREKVEFSKSSKSSIGEYSSTTTISEESTVSVSSRIGYKPHMSKDLRWEFIHNIQKHHGSLGLRHFKLLKKLGIGDIGTVYLAELTGTNCLFALKIMDIDLLASTKKMSRAQTEREILQMLDHPFLPTLFAHFTADKFSCLVMEYCPGGDLHMLRQKQINKYFSEAAARFYAAEVLLALEYLHMLGVVYRDLKPENIMIREDGHIMLLDFDLSLRCTVNPKLLKSLPVLESTKRDSSPCTESCCMHPVCLQPSWQVPCFTPRLISAAAKSQKLKSDLAAQVSLLPQLVAEPTSARSNSFVGTHEYLAPEIIKGEGHGSAVDWWMFGIFLYELVYGNTPFSDPRNEDTLSNAVSLPLKFPASPIIGSHTKDLIRGLLVKEPENRLGSVKGAAEIKQHPFFEGLNWALIRCAMPPELPKFCDFGNVAADMTSKYRDCNKCQEDFESTGEHMEFEMF